MSGRSALERCVGDTEAFLAERFTVGPHEWRSGDFADLLSLADVDRLVAAGGLRQPAVRLVRDGCPVAARSWTRTARTGSTVLHDVVDPAGLLREHAAGATVVLQSLHRWWPSLVAFCRDLEEDLGHTVQANAYLTPAGAAGLAPHHDTHDVFVLQVHGSKHWTLRAPIVADPLPRQRSTAVEAGAQEVLGEVHLTPGSALYLPRGVVHSARAQEGSSLHLTVGVLATTVHDVAREVLTRAAEHPAMRRPLPVRWAERPEVAEAAVRAALAELLAAVAATDPAPLAEHLASRHRNARRPDLTGALLDLDRASSLDDATVVVRRRHVSGEVTATATGCTLTLSDRVLHLPTGLAPALAVLLDGRPHRLGELDRWLSGSSRLVLGRRLLREGVLRAVDPEDAGRG